MKSHTVVQVWGIVGLRCVLFFGEKGPPHWLCFAVTNRSERHKQKKGVVPEAGLKATRTDGLGPRVMVWWRIRAKLWRPCASFSSSPGLSSASCTVPSILVVISSALPKAMIRNADYLTPSKCRHEGIESSCLEVRIQKLGCYEITVHQKPKQS